MARKKYWPSAAVAPHALLRELQYVWRPPVARCESDRRKRVAQWAFGKITALPVRATTRNFNHEWTRIDTNKPRDNDEARMTNAEGRLPESMEEESDCDKVLSVLKPVWRVFAYVRRYAWLAAGTLACAILGTLMVIVFPAVRRSRVDEWVRQRRVA